jgi:SAM-dependent methyltransferase
MKYIASRAAISRNGRVLEVGSYDMNGSPRKLFYDCLEYLGIDRRPGPGVDIVMDCHDLKFHSGTFDVVIDAERLEHDTDFFQSYREIYRVLRPGGHVIVTARSWGGFHPHCLPEDYWRFTLGGLKLLLLSSGFVGIEAEYGEEWKATRDCGETGGCVEHPLGGKHNDVFAHAVYGFAVKP